MDDDVEFTALAINVTIPEALRWTDVRRGTEFQLSTLNVRLKPNGHLAAKAYGRAADRRRSRYLRLVPGARPAGAGGAGVGCRPSRRRAVGRPSRPRLTGASHQPAGGVNWLTVNSAPCGSRKRALRVHCSSADRSTVAPRSSAVATLSSR